MSILQTAQRNNFYSIGACISHFTACDDNHKVWFAKFNLFFSLVVFLHQPFDFL